MRHRFVFLLVFLLAGGCASTPPNTSFSPEKLDKPLSLFTNVKGPSEESGDCGGYAFWLRETDGKFTEGEVSIFEGGCAIYKKAILEIQHDPKSGKLIFLGTSWDPEQLVRFEGKVAKGKIVGVVTNVNKSTRAPVNPKGEKKQRSFEKTDPEVFRRSIPSGSET